MKKTLLILVAFVTFLNYAHAQKITAPKDFLGYELGTKFSRHNQVVDYFKKVASELPNQVKLEQYGETNERRPLYIAYISSEENIRQKTFRYLIASPSLVKSLGE